MTKPLLIFISLLLFLDSSAQRGSLVVKRNHKVVYRYWTGREIAFQTSDKAWHKGTITRLTPDSFYIQPIKVLYNMMGTDTISYNKEGYRHTDIYTVPKKGILINNVTSNGFTISRTGGHVHFFWIKGGFIFKMGAAAYAGIRMANTIGDKFSWKKESGPLLTAAGVYGFGVLLRKLYNPFYKIGKRYRCEYINLNN